MIVEFHVGPEELGRGELVTVTPHIDGTSLVELARRAELGPATQEGQPELAGRYAGLVIGDCGRDWAGWYLNDHPQSWFGDGDSCLLGCICGDTCCWPLTARITVGREQVTWTGFRTGHRSWDLSGMGPFMFDRLQYDSALR